MQNDETLKILRKEFDDLSIPTEMQIENKNRQVLEVLQFVAERVNYTETRRFGYLQIGLAFIAVAGAGGVALLSIPDKISFLMLILQASTFNIFITGGFLIVLYDRQTNPRYPFVDSDVTKTWKWFYHYMDIKNLKSKIRYGKQEKDEYNKNYLDSLNRYTKNIISENAQNELKQNIEQLHLFLVLEKFKNDYTRKLQEYLFLGITVTAWVIFIIGLLWYFIFPLSSFWSFICFTIYPICYWISSMIKKNR